MARKDEPYTVEITFDTGRTRQVTYANRKEMIQYVGRALLDNGYVSSKSEAQTIAPRILEEPIRGRSGPTYSIAGCPVPYDPSDDEVDAAQIAEEEYVYGYQVSTRRDLGITRGAMRAALIAAHHYRGQEK